MGGRRGMGSCTSGSIGVRINPQLGAGGIATTGTVAPTSKFGVALEEARPQLLAAYGRYAWLSCVHVHVGSQGCPLGLLVQGASAVLQLAQEINAHVGSRQVRVLDLGGGLLCALRRGAEPVGRLLTDGAAHGRHRDGDG